MEGVMILKPQHILELRCEFEELMTEKEGMLALNQQRMFAGQAMAYTDDAFFTLAAKIKLLREKIIQLGDQ